MSDGVERMRSPAWKKKRFLRGSRRKRVARPSYTLLSQHPAFGALPPKGARRASAHLDSCIALYDERYTAEAAPSRRARGSVHLTRSQ